MPDRPPRPSVRRFRREPARATDRTGAVSRHASRVPYTEQESGMRLWDVLAVVVYLLAVVFLGYLGWRRTRSASDYMLAGRKAHPVIMAVSYGATFISTSAI